MAANIVIFVKSMDFSKLTKPELPSYEWDVEKHQCKKNRRSRTMLESHFETS